MVSSDTTASRGQKPTWPTWRQSAAHRRSEGLALLNQEYRQGVGALSHTHEFEEILTIVEGTAEVWMDNKRSVVGPATTVFVRTLR
jgi:mannose-6-phosphate isomerase-like protein (cupin superfamily)